MATRTRSTVVAVFRNAADAEAAATDLKASGFRADDVYVSTADSRAGVEATTHHTAHEEGGIRGWFHSLFGDNDSDNDRAEYENAVQSGNVLLSVETTEENMNAVADVLSRHSPIDIHREDGAADTRSANTPVTAEPAKTKGGKLAEETNAIPVISEELKVGKRSVLKGGVRVYSRTVEEPVQENVRLREETVRVERTPANRAATAAELRPGQEQVIEVQEFAEEPVITKEARVIEEVRVHKDAVERNETIRDSVRRTEVNVEDIDNSRAVAETRSAMSDNSPYDDDYRRDFTARYGSTGAGYEDFSPAYRYGSEMAADQRYRGRSFDEVESDLRTDYSRRYPTGTWEKMKDSIRYGWDKVTGKARS